MTPSTSTPSAPTLYQAMVQVKNALISGKDKEDNLQQLSKMNIDLDLYKYLNLESLVTEMVQYPEVKVIAQGILHKYSLLEKRATMTANLVEMSHKRKHATTSKKQQIVARAVLPKPIVVAPRAPLANKSLQKTSPNATSMPVKKDSEEARRIRLEQLVQKSRQVNEKKNQAKENRLKLQIVAPLHQEPIAKKAKYARKS